MQHKDYTIKFRAEAQTKQLLNEIAHKENLDVSKLLRTLIHNHERPFTLSERQMNTLEYHFTNAARLGGLLNQIAYHLNSGNIDVMNGQSENMEVDAKELKIICLDLEYEVKKLKSKIVDMCRNHQVV